MATAAKLTPVANAPRLALLREPFPPHQISKLPKETRSQIDARKADKKVMVWKCDVCGGAHHKDATHLDYVGHAALTDRLLDADLEWSWEPVAFGPDGLPALDRNGGLWIKLTVDGVTRYGYGSADGKSGGDAVKELIGDALRNAAMRFGAALDLWHKGELHAHNDDGDEAGETPPALGGPAPRTKLEGPFSSKTALKKAIHELHGKIAVATDTAEVDAILRAGKATIAQAEHDWPELLNGSPDIAEDIGLKGAVALKREALADDGSFGVMIDSLNQCETLMQLTNWMAGNEAMIEELDDLHRRKFETARETREAAILAMDRVNA